VLNMWGGRFGGSNYNDEPTTSGLYTVKCVEIQGFFYA
jgi:hypothetical protein